MCSPRMFGSTEDDGAPTKNTSGLHFPTIHDPLTLEIRPEALRPEDYHTFVWDPCHGGEKYKLEPGDNPEDEYKLLANGSIYLTLYGTIVNFTDYCLGAVDRDAYDVVLCFDAGDYDDDAAARAEGRITVAFPVGMILSVPFLLVTFVIYSVIPELRNMHGSTLRGYVGPLIVAYTVLSILQIVPQNKITDGQCIFMGT